MQREADPRTPMAWQHRDLNYHQSGYQDRYGPGAEAGRLAPGPSSNSDRLSYRTDRSWRAEQANLSPYGPSTSSSSQYPPRDYPTKDYPSRDYPGRDYPPRDYPPRDYPHSSRDRSPSDHRHHQQHTPSEGPRGNGAPPPPTASSSSVPPHHHQSRHSDPSTLSSTTSSSSSEGDSEETPPHMQGVGGPPPHNGHPAGYPGGYYPGGGYPPSHMGYAASMAGGYPGTMKSAKSVPAFTFDGEPCPVHHGGPPGPHMPHMPHPHPPMPPMAAPPMSMPPMVHPGFATMGPPRRAASIYDMRMMSPPPTIYGTLPHPGPPPSALETKSVAGSAMMGPAAPGAPLGIPPSLLPPMARPRPLVIGEGGNPAMLPIRASKDKGADLPKAMSGSKAGDSNGSEDLKLMKKPFCCRGGSTVAYFILTVVVIGVLLILMLLFIL